MSDKRERVLCCLPPEGAFGWKQWKRMQFLHPIAPAHPSAQGHTHSPPISDLSLLSADRVSAEAVGGGAAQGAAGIQGLSARQRKLRAAGQHGQPPRRAHGTYCPQAQGHTQRPPRATPNFLPGSHATPQGHTQPPPTVTPNPRSGPHPVPPRVTLILLPNVTPNLRPGSHVTPAQGHTQPLPRATPNLYPG